MTDTTTPAQVTAFKAFTPSLTCRDFQFEIGKTYEHDGKVIACFSGFHACDNPLDTLSYYPLVSEDGSFGRFARVTMSGEISRENQKDTKLAAAKITIDVELKFPEFIKAGVDWLIAATKVAVGADTDSSGDDAQIGSSGDDAQIG
ncbi:MAG: hypothetical protein QM681_19615, partial [Novosphingobium sp.]